VEPARLDQALVESSLQALPQWSGDTESISRTVPVTAGQADQLLEAVAASAKAMNHDPAVEQTEGQVRFVLTTHSAGGVTALDVAMASHINDLVAQATGVPAEHPQRAVADTTDDEADAGGGTWPDGHEQDIVNRGLRRMPD
jgi:4a-hydroxytetrahydrobiopterin dehydratase